MMLITTTKVMPVAKPWVKSGVMPQARIASEGPQRVESGLQLRPAACWPDGDHPDTYLHTTSHTRLNTLAPSSTARRMAVFLAPAAEGLE